MAQRVITQVENICDVCGNVIYDEVTHANKKIGSVFLDNGVTYSYSLNVALQGFGRSIDMVCKTCAEKILRGILDSGF